MTVERVQFVDTEDGTVVYIKDTEHGVYKQAFKENEDLIRISEGDVITLSYEQVTEDANEIHLLREFEFSVAGEPEPTPEP